MFALVSNNPTKINATKEISMQLYSFIFYTAEYTILYIEYGLFLPESNEQGKSF